MAKAKTEKPARTWNPNAFDEANESPERLIFVARLGLNERPPLEG